MFSIWDYIVFGATVAISIGIGGVLAFRNRKSNNAETYFLGDRKFNWFPLALSFMVSFQSSLMVLGTPAEVYVYGMEWCFLSFGILISYLFGAIFIVPVLHPLKLTSVYTYFQMRYHTNSVRFLALTFGMIYYLMYMAVIIFGTSLALSVTLGIPFWATVAIYLIAASLYTALGGMKAVIWTDVFQTVVMVAGIIAVLVRSTIEAGGFTQVFIYGKERLDVWDFNLDPTVRHTFWTVTVGSTFTYFYLTCTQVSVQRINSTPDVQSARKVLLMSGPAFVIVFLMVCFTGLSVFGYYSARSCDIFSLHKVTNINQIMPHVITDLFGDTTGFPGLFIASLTCATLSSLSSCLSALSAMIHEDFLRVRYPNMSGTKAVFLSKLSVPGFGIIVLLLTFMFSQVSGSLGSIFAGFSGSMDGPSVGLFMLSMFFRRATSTGAVIGMLSGMVLPLWIILGKNFSSMPPTPKLPLAPTDKCPAMLTDASTQTAIDILSNFTVSQSIELQTLSTTIMAASEKSGLETLYSISYWYTTAIGCLVTVIVGMAVSLCTKPPTSVDSRCLFSACRMHCVMKGSDSSGPPQIKVDCPETGYQSVGTCESAV